MADPAAESAKDIRVECAETSPVIRTLTVEVDPARVDRAFDRAYGDLRKSVRVKGFRPGKVPRSVLERMYGAGMPDEIERVLVSETLAAAIEQAEVMPVSEPDIDAEAPQPGTAFRYTARVEVKPEITLPDLSGLEGTRPLVEVTDADVDAELEQIRERNAALVEESEDTEAADGHTVTIDFVGRIDGETFQGGTAQGVDLQLGSGTMVPGFEDQLIGTKAGDDRQVTVTFPDDYGPEELNGKEAVFDCHVVAVKRREVPDLDDELAKDVGDFDSLEALRERIASDARKQREAQSERALNQSLIDSLVALSDFEVPPGIVERQLQGQMRSMHDQFHGRVPDDMLHEQLRRMQEDGRPMAEKRVREALLLEKIVSEQELSAGEEEVEERLGEMADAQGMELDQLRTMAAQQGWLQAIEHELVEKKAYGWLAEQATIRDVDPAEADDEAGSEDADAD